MCQALCTYFASFQKCTLINCSNFSIPESFSFFEVLYQFEPYIPTVQGLCKG